MKQLFLYYNHLYSPPSIYKTFWTQPTRRRKKATYLVLQKIKPMAPSTKPSITWQITKMHWIQRSTGTRHQTKTPSTPPSPEMGHYQATWPTPPSTGPRQTRALGCWMRPSRRRDQWMEVPTLGRCLRTEWVLQVQGKTVFSACQGR